MTPKPEVPAFDWIKIREYISEGGEAGWSTADETREEWARFWAWLEELEPAQLEESNA
jgi:hypothetical protein